VAALAAGALVCLMVGVLAGVMATGGRPADVLTVLRDPATPASATVKSGHGAPTRTVTVTRSIAASGAAPSTRIRTRTVTVSAPASTVTETDTVTETVTATAPAPTTQAP
jgi:hypothetical protein